MAPNIFFHHFVSFFEKIVKWKCIQKFIIFYKKFIFIFVARCAFLQKVWSPGNGFLQFSQKIQLFLKELLNNKIFSTYLICDKRDCVNFWGKTPSFPVNGQMCPITVFYSFHVKYCFFRKNCCIKKYSASN